MQNHTLSKRTISFGWALAAASVANALLVIAKEKSPAVQSVLKRLTGNHWVTHVILIVFLFCVIGLLWPVSNRNQDSAAPVNRLIKTIVSSILVSGLIIVGFYLIAG